MSATMRFVAPLLLVLAQATASATTTDFDQELSAIIRDYDSANYDSSGDEAKVKAFDAVVKRAANLAKQYPNRGEALVWQGQSQAAQSAVDRSLGLAKQARKTLEAAVAITPNAYAIEAYSTLGAMYANIPGFPLAFGDKKKARECYQKALAINSNSIGANVGYASLLLKLDQYADAIKHASAGLNGTPRPGREKADKASRANAENIIAKAKAKLR
jgi:tetratricopeptide (TPR) repeat protein